MLANESSRPSRTGMSRQMLGWAALLVLTVLVGAAVGLPGARETAPKRKGGTLHAVTIRKPTGPPVIRTGAIDHHGEEVTVACNTCHATKPANLEARMGQGLPLFHQGQKGTHGELACTSCHNPADGYQSLRLANGRSVPFTEVMQLCAQCHGPQYRDYLHGAHGGMSGYWDLTQGPRVRNNCVDCHAPHSPRYPIVRPARGPGDLTAPGNTRRVGHD